MAKKRIKAYKKGELYKEYNGLIEASEDLELSSTYISTCIRESKETKKGFLFKYVGGNKNKVVVFKDGVFEDTFSNVKKAADFMKVGAPRAYHLLKTGKESIDGFSIDFEIEIEEDEKLNFVKENDLGDKKYLITRINKKAGRQILDKYGDFSDASKNSILFTEEMSKTLALAFNKADINKHNDYNLEKIE